MRRMKELKRLGRLNSVCLSEVDIRLGLGSLNFIRNLTKYVNIDNFIFLFLSFWVKRERQRKCEETFVWIGTSTQFLTCEKIREIYEKVLQKNIYIQKKSVQERMWNGQQYATFFNVWLFGSTTIRILFCKYKKKTSDFTVKSNSLSTFLFTWSHLAQNYSKS